MKVVWTLSVLVTGWVGPTGQNEAEESFVCIGFASVDQDDYIQAAKSHLLLTKART